ncbi:MAG: tetratricopeptide repeat protein [Bacteroidales bacterium]|nr:MAG: tetratricopeptide repeat protein [Bacteroidales bacterium]
MIIKEKTTNNKHFVKWILYLISLIYILAIYSCNLREKRSNSIVKNRIDSLISWNNEDYSQKPNEAFEIIEHCKSLAIETADPEIIGNVLNKEASFLKQLNHYAKAIQAYKQAAKLFTKSEQEEKLANTYFNLADIYKTIGEYSKSLDHCSKGLELYQRIKNKGGIKRCYRVMGSVYKYLKDYEKSLQYYKMSLALSREEGNDDDIATALNNLGTAYSSMGNDSAALKLYYQCFEIYSKTNSISGLATSYNNIGSILMNKGQYKQAIENFRFALKYRKQTNYKPREAIILDNIGDYFYETNQLDSSIYYYKQSLEISIKYGLKDKMSSFYSHLSKAYLKNKMPYDAYRELEKHNQVRDTVFDAQKSIEIAKIETNFDTYKEQLQSKSDRQQQKLILIIYTLSISIFAVGFIYIFKRHRQSITKQRNDNQTLTEEKSRIEEDLSDKNKELITYSLQIAQQQEIDKALAERIQIEIDSSIGETKKKLQAILHNINTNAQRINIWEDFELRFNQVNQNFYQNLLQEFPSLSQNERRLCAFLKLNLSTKEITIITGQSPQSINVARCRLRKKLGLANSNENLFDFFQRF